MTEMSKAAYDAAWDHQWDDMKTYGPFSRHVRRLIMHMIHPLEFSSVLDVGCGQGAMLIEIANAYPAVEIGGTDFSPAAIEIARRRLPRGKFSILDLTKEALDGTFDLVLCSEVLEHIDQDSMALQNLRRMTGRYLVVTTPQGRMRRFEPAEVGHVRNYARGELHTKLRASGFVPIRTIEWGFPLYSPLYRNYLELTSGRGTTGHFGFIRKSLASVLFYAFMLNSWTRGDELVVLAQCSSATTSGV